LVGWGNQVNILKEASRLAKEQNNVSCEIIDLQTIIPWDKYSVMKSVKKTGRLLIAHEAPKTAGFAAEIASQIQEECLYNLKSPIIRVTGWDTPFPLVFEQVYLPDRFRCYEAIVSSMNQFNSL
jgi:2-oxoisovalerate dehydrogenase E1 component beta subunit